MDKSELEPKQIFGFIDYKFDLKEGKVRITLLDLVDFKLENPETTNRSLLSGLTAYVPDRPVDIYGEIHLGWHHMRLMRGS